MREKQTIAGILQTWPETFYYKFGRKPTRQEIISAITERKKTLELQAIETVFCDYSSIELDAVLELLNECHYDNIEDTDNQKSKKSSLFDNLTTKKK